MARLNSATPHDGARAVPVRTATIVPLDERRADAPAVAGEIEAEAFDLDDVFEEPARRGF